MPFSLLFLSAPDCPSAIGWMDVLANIFAWRRARIGALGKRAENLTASG
jgi:hypothetical protein